MKKLIIFLAVLLSLSSCKGTKIVTEIVTETKWRDTTVYVEIPVYVDKIIEVPLPVHDTLVIKQKVYINELGLAEMKSMYKEEGIIGTEVVIKNGELNARSFLLDSTILYHFKDTLTAEDSITIYDAIKEKTTTTTKILPPEKYVPKIYKISLIIVILGILALVGWVVLKINGGMYLKKIINVKNNILGG